MSGAIGMRLRDKHFINVKIAFEARMKVLEAKLFDREKIKRIFYLLPIMNFSLMY